MKKIVILCLILFLACVALARDIKSCERSKWFDGHACRTCPAYAKCNGKTFKCLKNYAVQEDGCVKVSCEKDQWISKGKCYKCPANADCRDGKSFVCKKGYTEINNKCVMGGTCSANQWLNKNKCVACPKDAKCDGKRAVCNEKSHKVVGNQCVCTGAAWKKEGKLVCSPCPRNAMCDGKGNWTCKRGFTADIHYQRGAHTSNIPGCVDAGFNMTSATVASNGTYFACEGKTHWKCTSKYVCGCVK